MAKVNRRRLARTLYIIWIVITVIAITVPIGKMPERKIFRGLDKTVHTGLFVVMGVLGQNALPWLSLAISLPIAVGTEILQRALPTSRQPEGADLISNLIGLFLGIISYEITTRLKQ